MKYLHFCILSVLLTVLSCAPEPAGTQEMAADGQFIRMQLERLPDLNSPRGGHGVLLLGDEPTVFGGHTDGFKLLRTAEYFKDGTWHEIPMAYLHDGGFQAQLPDGIVMVGGGSSEDFGIGQSWGVEVYDPSAHAFRGMDILDRKRAYASALTLPDGRVVVSGNWYADDGIGLYSPKDGFVTVKELPSGRVQPWILPEGEDMIVFGGEDNYGKEADARMDRLVGESSREPLLEDWAVFRSSYPPEQCGIGLNTYLIPARNRTDGSFGVIRVTDGHFSLLETEEPLPTEGIDGERIKHFFALQTDRRERLVWLYGNGDRGRYYVARLDYDAIFDGRKAGIQLYYAEHPDGGFASVQPILLPGEGFLVAGGVGFEKQADSLTSSNFVTSREVWLLRTEPRSKAAFPWGWAALLLAAVLALAAVYVFRRKKPESVPPASAETEEGTNRSDLLGQIVNLIEEKELWKRADLRLDDIARELASNRMYISTLLNSISGVSFTTLINGYRIKHAQQLMREHPDMLMDTVAEESGFSSRTAFFRNFKAQTGMTPKQWLSQAADENV